MRKLNRSKKKGAKLRGTKELTFVKERFREKQRHIAKHRQRKARKSLPGMTKRKHFELASLLSEAYVQRREHLFLRVSQGTKFPAGFPLGRTVSCEDSGHKIVRIRVEKALVWMCQMGYNELSFDELKDARKEALLMWNRIERRLM